MMQTHPIYFDGTMSEKRAKQLAEQLKNVVQPNRINVDVKMDDGIRRMISGNPYPHMSR